MIQDLHLIRQIWKSILRACDLRTNGFRQILSKFIHLIYIFKNFLLHRIRSFNEAITFAPPPHHGKIKLV